jgi:hypothetical protein
MRHRIRLPRRTRASRALRLRSGIALFIAMFFVAGIGALALSAIYLTANASLISKSYEKEDDLKYASEAALAIGKASLNFNPAILPNTSYVSMMSNQPVQTADGQTIPNITVNMWVGQTGSTTGQFGRFASLVSEARDLSGVGFVRRLELSQESFAKYAYWTNSETNNGSVIYFGNGDQIWGPVWSNDNININTSGATFRDNVGTAGVINGVGYGTFNKGYSINQRPINLPPLTTLTTLSGLAAVGGMSFTGITTGDETTLRQRIEFVSVDLNGDSDSTDADEGFFRIYEVPAGRESWIRGDWPTGSSPPAIGTVKQCGDFHDGKFYPAAIHPTSWFRDTLVAHGWTTVGNTLNNHTTLATTNTVMSSPGARCYLGGDPHLVAVSRTGAAGQRGGEDTTVTQTDSIGGSWRIANATPTGNLSVRRPADGKFLYPLYRGYNNNTKGVIYVSGTVGISGVLRLDKGITLYTPNTLVLLDDMRYANDPSLSTRQCNDILGLIAGGNIVVANNAINTPQLITSTTRRSLDDTQDMYIHAVMMALGTAFTVEDFGAGPSNSTGCQGTPNGRGCLFLTGGVIQNNRGAVGQSNGNGFIKRYSYDRCAVVNPPPYFPTTGRFQDNRYYELDPVRFNVTNLYRSIQPNP